MSQSPEIREAQQTSSSYRCFDSPYAKPLFIALGIIVMIGGLTANGVLYSTLGYAAFGFTAGGGVLGIILIAIPLSKQEREPTELVEEGTRVGMQPIQGRVAIQLNYRLCCSIASETRDPQSRGRPANWMSDYSIIPRRIIETVKSGPHSLPIQRSIGVMLGMAIGDAEGAPYEFLPYRAQEGYLENEKRDRFQLQAGQWTDDTSMGLCLADMLITYPDELDERQLMWAFYDWWHHGYNNAFTQGTYRHSVGLGGNISLALDHFQSLINDRHVNRTSIIGEPSFPTAAGDQNTSGNGSLMRNGPVAIYATSVEQAMKLAERQSRVTHKGDEAAACCRLMAFIIYHAIHDENGDPGAIKQALLEKLQAFDCTVPSVNELARSKNDVANAQNPEQMENWNWQDKNYTFSEQQLNRPNPAYAGAYAMDGLAMALHCVFMTNTFEDAILKATRHGGDADTIGAIAGQIAGAIYGQKGIPQDWINKVERWDRGGEIAARGYLLQIKMPIGAIYNGN